MIALTGIPVLQTARLTLRGPKDSDAGPLGAFLESPRARNIGGPWPASDAPDWLAFTTRRWAERGRGLWFVALKDNDTPIGRIGLLDHSDWHEPELAWFLFAGYDGKGYAYEAALAARSFAADSLKLPPLFSFIEASNARSKALAQRLGAKPERDTIFHETALTVYRHPSSEALQ
jgi:RimJ/RimL family protein N-acetyltransferase